MKPLLLIHSETSTTTNGNNDTNTTKHDNDNTIDNNMYIEASRNGTNGVSTNGVTAFFVVFCQRDFLGTPVNLLLSSQKCQGVPFSPICQNPLLLQLPR